MVFLIFSELIHLIGLLDKMRPWQVAFIILLYLRQIYELVYFLGYQLVKAP